MQTKLVGSAHLIQGGADAIPTLLALLKKEGIETKGNPDIYLREYARFGVVVARELRERATLRSTAARGRIFIIATPTLTTEAQNVLLKTFEEPAAGASFFLIVPAPQSLLPTLRSRMQVLQLAPSEGNHLVDTKKFLAASGEQRLEMLKALLEKDEDDKRDLRPILEFLSSLEMKLAKNPVGLDAACREGLESVYRARKYIGDKGALLKPLLEQVALLVPKM
jgi:DNA polymerase III delta prime subunit